MGVLRGKQQNKKNLLELAAPERAKLMKQASEQMRQMVIEAKLWQSFLDVDNLAINGNTIYDSAQQLNGLHLDNKMSKELRLL